MDLLKKQKGLIEKLVKSNPKFNGNEDLIEDFCSETYQKSYFILQSIEDINTLEIYLKKVVSSAIIDVLKINGRIVRNTNGYSSIKEINLPFEKPVEYISPEDLNYIKEKEVIATDLPQKDIEREEKQEKEHSFFQNYKTQTRDISIDLEGIKDPRDGIEEQIIRKDIIENIITLVKQINKEQPEEKFLKIFFSRYFLQMKQREISQEIGVSQSEISKRLVHLSRLVKEKLYQ